MNNIQISIEAKGEDQDILVSQLSELGAEGFEQTDERLIAYFNELEFKSYEVNELLKPFQFIIDTLQEQNWNKVWESNFHPVMVEDFCSIRAEFHPPVSGVQHEIVITPKMSFGTGHHATTWLMMQQMRDVDFKDRKVFDFGTGTGILSILAEKLGASKIEAIDVDHWSIENAMENAQKNSCTRIAFHLTSEIPDDCFHIILANINRNVILQNLERLSKTFTEKLLLSGLLISDEEMVLTACKLQGLRRVARTEKNNWICLLIENEQSTN
ncbi:MAG: 50S ribosomal protein L11 methyltransferase [Flavisolibacter sp.]